MTPSDTKTPHPASELAQSITDRPYLSWTQVQLYQSCPRAFAFRYVDRATPEFTPSSLAFGGAIHNAISLHHECRLTGASTTMDNMMELCREALSPADAPLRYGKEESYETLVDLAQRMLQAFLDSEFANPEGSTICIEETVAGSIDAELPPIEGRVDLVVEHEDHLVITDYKTSRSKWGATKPEEHAGQLRLYGDLIQKRLGSDEPALKLQFVTITKAKKPKVESHPIEPVAIKLESTKSQIREVWQGIAEGVFPPRPSWQCKSCPFQGRCDAAAI